MTMTDPIADMLTRVETQTWFVTRIRITCV